MRTIALVGAAAVAVALALTGIAGADGTPLKGSVGPGFAISLRDATGASVTRLDAGAYSLDVNDLSDEHDFHLTGPGGVDVGTTIEESGQKSFAVTLVDGKYSFFCDAHPLRMKGSFNVGVVTEPPPTTPASTTPPPKAGTTRLTLTVTNAAIGLRTASGAAVRKVKAGAFSIRVVDRSKKQNAHLVAAGVNRRTGLAFVGTVTWKVRLKTGKLTYRSDAATPKLGVGSATVS